ncbi:MAG: RagB/SusD family nutrient uptake outer membrane protein, partial [Bacteroidota bacterium]
MRYICLFFFAFLAFSGCDDELLEVTPRNSVSTESFFRTESDLELYANGLVSVPEGGAIFLSDQSSDNAATTGAVEIKTIMNASPTSQTIVGGWDWERLRSVNFFLENIDRAEVSDAVKDHYRGLARMYRAEFYYDKVKRFSDVPWFGRVLNPDDEDLYKPQDDRAMVVDNVLEDLTFAAEHVREDVPVGTPDKWVATMLLARVALHEGTFRKYHDELNLEASAD